MTGIPRKAQLPFVAALLLWIPLAFLHPLGAPKRRAARDRKAAVASP